MRTILIVACAMFFFSCQEEDASPEFQTELFTYIKTHGNPDAPKCDTSFSIWRNEELTVFCIPPATADSQTREWIKSETTSIVMKWAQESNRNPKSILTRFTDEIEVESKK